MTHRELQRITRRHFFGSVGFGSAGFGIGSLALASTMNDKLFAADALSGGFHHAPKAKSIIFLHQWGGPGQHETFDPKPDAPDNVRGWYGATKTKLPGVIICEHLPKLAAMLDRLRRLGGGTDAYRRWNLQWVIESAGLLIRLTDPSLATEFSLTGVPSFT